MNNLAKSKYLRPTITQITIELEHSLAASSVTVSAGGEQSSSPQMEDWIEEVDNQNLQL
ncbi:hypothetical protein J5U18_11005 [Sphingobacteriaceae bacterium WQ 2009]|uniref:Uncharacterized protein n=1 Tax=Rhinopithecimicrobium faecis TaxID=2820698 RepID=A0A8T4HAZ3_9SPHI|nr:hypothetical protein [Sphingobacteriaceae bacterium WQ 2009]